jgi:hypothetical protein
MNRNDSPSHDISKDKGRTKDWLPPCIIIKNCLNIQTTQNNYRLQA